MDQPLINPRALLRDPQPLMSFHLGFIVSGAPGGLEPLFLGSIEGNRKGRIIKWRQTRVQILILHSLASVSSSTK